MSVVVVSLDRYERIRLTVAALRAQTAMRRLELVIVAPSRDVLNLDEGDLQEFFSFQVVEVGAIRSTGGAIAAGFQKAKAPVVAYAEEHSYPFPTWAEALLLAHRHPWAAVGAAIVNANPDTIISWANLFTDFGPSVEPALAGVTSHLAWHHTSYKRELLTGYETEDLQSYLETEGFLHQALQDRGYQLYLEPAAKSNHVNVSTVRSLIRCEFVGGRLFGAARVHRNNWSVTRRLLYILASPVIPIVRLRRTLREVHRTGRFGKLFPRILPSMLTALAAHCLGEISGYAFGAGDAAWQRVPCELNRCEFLAAAEKKSVRR
ncbi:MAG: glycosyltransferase family 2 protein [Casimicrobiaceae bacterium]